MVDLPLPSLLSSPQPIKHHHLPVKALDTSKPISSIFTTRKSLAIVYGFTLVFVVCIFFSAFNPSTPWPNSFIRTTANSIYPQSHFLTIFSGFSDGSPPPYQPNIPFELSNEPFSMKNSRVPSPDHKMEGLEETIKNPLLSDGKDDIIDNVSMDARPFSKDSIKDFPKKNQYLRKKENVTQKNIMEKERPKSTSRKAHKPKKRERKGKYRTWVEKMKNCNMFDGGWVKDNSYPLFKPGSCPLIDEPFNCFINGRPDKEYEKYRWQPNHCNIPRLNGKFMLEMLRGKRIVFIGDSLNRNMWESMVCILRNAAKDKSKIFEASGREEFKTEGSYSFVFKDYNCSVEFFRSTFLVQEWEMLETNGSKKQTLRIDMVERSADKYKTADVLIFNTGHWWTHEKTSSGKNYYQEGSHIYNELHVEMAFRKAMATWARWMEAHVDPFKTLVVFRGYSVSHFRGGEWNSGGHCDGETEPLKEETDFESDPFMVKILESVLQEMKKPVFYLNVTRMTNFRKDAHPSIYRKRDIPVEEKRSPLRFQDCSHWCLPGVPDTWNEIIYAQLLLRHKQKRQHQHHVKTKSL